MLPPLARRALPLIETRARAIGAHSLLDFGPVFLPSEKNIFRSTIDLIQHAPKERVLAVSCFPLSLLSEVELNDLFSQACARASHTLFLDFKRPERNLEYPAVFLFTPLRIAVSQEKLKQHHELEEVLYRERHRFSVLSRDTLFGGGLSCALVQHR